MHVPQQTASRLLTADAILLLSATANWLPHMMRPMCVTDNVARAGGQDPGENAETTSPEYRTTARHDP